MSEDLIKKLENLFDTLMDQGKEVQAEKIGDVLDRVTDGLEIRTGDQNTIDLALKIASMS